MNHRWLRALLAGACLAVALPVSTALACSPPFNPTIRELGPAQIVVVGTIGEKVPGGRLFHVESWFNGGEPVTPMVIGFKEGDPVGDCSYRVSAGTKLIIAPFRQPDGSLYADLGTLQADPASEDGVRYINEAIALFGPGVVPEPVAPPADEQQVPPEMPFVVAIALALIGSAAWIGWRRRREVARLAELHGPGSVRPDLTGLYTAAAIFWFEGLGLIGLVLIAVVPLMAFMHGTFPPATWVDGTVTRLSLVLAVVASVSGVIWVVSRTRLRARALMFAGLGLVGGIALAYAIASTNVAVWTLVAVWLGWPSLTLLVVWVPRFRLPIGRDTS